MGGRLTAGSSLLLCFFPWVGGVWVCGCVGGCGGWVVAVGALRAWFEITQPSPIARYTPNAPLCHMQEHPKGGQAGSESRAPLFWVQGEMCLCNCGMGSWPDHTWPACTYRGRKAGRPVPALKTTRPGGGKWYPETPDRDRRHELRWAGKGCARIPAQAGASRQAHITPQRRASVAH